MVAKLKQINILHKQNLWKRTVVVLLAVMTMGFALSWLFLLDMGADPYTVMNRAIAQKLHISIGTWQLILNIFLFFIVFLSGGRNLGIGTIANMVLVGYSVDFFSWLWRKMRVENLAGQTVAKIVILSVALVIFVIAAAVYMDVRLGTSPYDAIPFIISEKLTGGSFRTVRILYDFSVITIGCLFGAKLKIMTVLMAVLLGPAVSGVAKWGAEKFPGVLGQED